jgi:hypothetical protein
MPTSSPQRYPAERTQIDPSGLCVEELATSICDIAATDIL